MLHCSCTTRSRHPNRLILNISYSTLHLGNVAVTWFHTEEGNPRKVTHQLFCTPVSMLRYTCITCACGLMFRSKVNFGYAICYFNECRFLIHFYLKTNMQHFKLQTSHSHWKDLHGTVHFCVSTLAWSKGKTENETACITLASWTKHRGWWRRSLQHDKPVASWFWVTANCKE